MVLRLFLVDTSQALDLLVRAARLGEAYAVT